MRKFVVGGLLAFAALAATVTPASAADWYYTGHWYPTAAACEEGYQDMVGGPVDLPHECRYDAGGNVYQLWRMR